jgi:hypothetical protein
MSEEGEFKKRFGLQKTFCVHEPIEETNGNITQEVHGSHRYPTHEEIEQVVDEARKDIFEQHCKNVCPMYPATCLRSCPILKWFGSESAKNTVK